MRPRCDPLRDVSTGTSVDPVHLICTSVWTVSRTPAGFCHVMHYLTKPILAVELKVIRHYITKRGVCFRPKKQLSEEITDQSNFHNKFYLGSNNPNESITSY